MTSQAPRVPPWWGERPILLLLAAAPLAAALPGCGGGGVSAPSVPASPAPVTTIVQEGSIGGLVSGGVAWGGFQTSTTGRLEVIIDWTSPSNNLDVFLTRGVCNPEQLVAGSCIVMATAESPTAKPERVTVDRAVDGLFTLFVVNLGATSETFSYQILLTHPPAAVVAP